MADLKTDYKDDVLDTTQNTKRKYQMIDNGDGTVSFEDVTEYIHQGDSFGADDINDTNEEVNIINDNLNKHTISYARRETLQFETDYTTLEDGYFMVLCPGSANGDINWVVGRLNGVSVAYVSNTGNPRMSTSAQANISGGTSIFVRKGSVISYTSSGSNIGTCYFYPLA